MASHPRSTKPPPRGRTARKRPVWDADAGALWWNGQVVKRVYREAPNQRLVLSTFAESALTIRRPVAKGETVNNGSVRRPRV
jgi:hypothetical protein